MSAAGSGTDTNAHDAWVQRVLGVRVPHGPEPGGSAENESDENVFEQPDDPNRQKLFVVPPESNTPVTGMAAWTAARAAALVTLKQLEAAYRGFEHPDSDEGIILLRAIQANLTAEPATTRQVDELESYVTSDDIFVEAEEPNGFGITVTLREPLLAAIASLRASMGGGGAAE